MFIVRHIIRIMRQNRCRDMLPRRIPTGEDLDGLAVEWIAHKNGCGVCRVEVGIVNLKGLSFALGMFFKPNHAIPARFKSLADYPPTLAMAEACGRVAAAFASQATASGAGPASASDSF